MIVCTSRCCAPSCRSRTTRRRSVVGRRHDPRPRRRQLRPRLDVRDRGRDQLGELRDARLGARRQRRRLPRRGDHRRPTGGRRRRSARRPRSGRRARARATPSGPVASAWSSMRAGRPVRWTSAATLLRRSTATACRPADAGVLAAGVRDERGGAVGLVAVQPRDVDAEQRARTSSATAAKTSAGGRLARDQRRHAPQRGLLVGEAPHLGPRLGVRRSRWRRAP